MGPAYGIKRGLEASTAHINTVDRYEFTGTQRTISRLSRYTEANPHVGPYPRSDSQQTQQHKLGVIRTLNHQAENVPTREKHRETEKQRIQSALKTCGDPNWAFIKTAKRNGTDQEKKDSKTSQSFSTQKDLFFLIIFTFLFILKAYNATFLILLMCFVPF